MAPGKFVWPEGERHGPELLRKILGAVKFDGQAGRGELGPGLRAKGRPIRYTLICIAHGDRDNAIS